MLAPRHQPRAVSNAQTNDHIWGQQCTRKAADIFALQANIPDPSLALRALIATFDATFWGRTGS
jgi:hypothetical protein